MRRKKTGRCVLQRKNPNWWKEGDVFNVFLCGSWTGVTRKEVVISCVATACPKNLQRDKMSMECCPVKKEEKSQNTPVEEKCLCHWIPKEESKAGTKGQVVPEKWLVPMVKEHVARKQWFTLFPVAIRRQQCNHHSRTHFVMQERWRVPEASVNAN